MPRKHAQATSELNLLNVNYSKVKHSVRFGQRFGPSGDLRRVRRDSPCTTTAVLRGFICGSSMYSYTVHVYHTSNLSRCAFYMSVYTNGFTIYIRVYCFISILLWVYYYIYIYYVFTILYLLLCVYYFVSLTYLSVNSVAGLKTPMCIAHMGLAPIFL